LVGSAFVLSLFGSDSEYCSRLASAANCIVLDADYSKDPENPFPAACNDIVDVLSFVLSSTQTYDVSRVTIGGFSSGANLALNVAGCAPVAKDNLRGVVSFYPLLDITKDNLEQALKASKDATDHPPKPPETSLRFFLDCYVPPQQPRDDPRVSPGFIDPANFPPILQIVPQYDLFSKDSQEWAAKLRSLGNSITSRTFNGMVHGWDKIDNPTGSEAEKLMYEAFDVVAKFLIECYDVRGDT
jgi:acetyl esterase/lipase